MRVTSLLRAGQYTPKIQFMGQKWKEAKSEFGIWTSWVSEFGMYERVARPWARATLFCWTVTFRT